MQQRGRYHTRPCCAAGFQPSLWPLGQTETKLVRIAGQFTSGLPWKRTQIQPFGASQKIAGKVDHILDQRPSHLPIN